MPILCKGRLLCALDEPEIGDMDEGVVEGCEDTGDAEDEFTWTILEGGLGGRDRGIVLAFSDLRAKGDILGSTALDLLLWRHLGG